MSQQSIITQVNQTYLNPLSAQQSSNNGPITMHMRGKKYTLQKDEMMGLPESLLLSLFPNGFMMESPNTTGGEGGGSIEVDFDPDCFGFILSLFRQTAKETGGSSATTAPGVPNVVGGIQSYLLPSTEYKGALIVLREDLDFYALPPKLLTKSAMNQLKKESGSFLLKHKSVFEGLRRKKDAHEELIDEGEISAEQHLIDMLCVSGYNKDDEWGYRALEPKKTCISSVAMAKLKADPAGENASTQELANIQTAQKLLLFFRKPARKCWWDGVYMDKSSAGDNIKIWIRRVWTLELSVFI